MKKRISTTYLCYVALMVALSTILSYFPEIPLAFFAPWLKLDFSFVPMLLIGFSFGPGASYLPCYNKYSAFTGLNYRWRRGAGEHICWRGLSAASNLNICKAEE